MNSVDCIIVGQGIAGSILGYKLWNKGKTFKIFSQPSKYDASWVAGGIVNPIAGRTMLPSWNIDEMLPEITPFYKSLNVELNSKIYHDISLHKVIDSIEHLNDFHSKTNPYLGDVIPSPNKSIKAEYGLGVINSSFRVDTATLITSCYDFFYKKNFLIDAFFDYNLLQIEDAYVRYGDIIAEYIVFAEGYKGRYNPYFQFIPWTHAKGEVIIIQSPDLQLDFSLNKNLLVIPMGDDLYKIGATFDRHNMDTNISDNARIELIEKLDAILSCPYTVVNQEVGIRPTSRDRKPFIGRHPTYPLIYIFNGIGTKGVSQAPYYADRLIENILENRNLEEKVNVKRYYSL